MTDREKTEKFNSEIRQQMAAGASYDAAFTAVTTLNPELRASEMPSLPSEDRCRDLLRTAGTIANTQDADVVHLLNAGDPDPITARGKLSSDQVQAAASFQSALSQVIKDNPGLHYTSASRLRSQRNPDLYQKMGQPAVAAKGVQYVTPAVQRGGAGTGTQQNRR